MKTFKILLFSLFISINLASAQDTLYIFKAGLVIKKHAVNKIDSITFKYTQPLPPTFTDVDGNIYHWITIGTQIWMVENLKTTKFRTGEMISNVIDANLWSNATFAAWCNYNNEVTNGTKYGHLYNLYAVNDNRKIAPIGWHIPSYDEWNTLYNYVTANPGFSVSAAKALAATSDWSSYTLLGSIGNDLTKNNSSGFTALPGGYRNSNGQFGYLNSWSYWWTPNESLYMVYYNSGVYFGSNNSSCGMYVRCIKD